MNSQTGKQAAPLSRRSKVTASALSSISSSTEQGLLKQLVKIVHAFMKVGIFHSVIVSLVHKFTIYLSPIYMLSPNMNKSSVLLPSSFQRTLCTVHLICPQFVLLDLISLTILSRLLNTVKLFTLKNVPPKQLLILYINTEVNLTTTKVQSAVTSLANSRHPLRTKITDTLVLFNNAISTERLYSQNNHE